MKKYVLYVLIISKTHYEVKRKEFKEKPNLIKELKKIQDKYPDCEIKFELDVFDIV